MTREELEAKVERLEGVNEIQNLQSRYNYYLAMYWGDRIVDELFAQKDPEVYVYSNGTEFHGVEAIRRNFHSLDNVHKNEPGRMGAIMVLQPLIDVAEDGKTGRGCFYLFGPCVLPMQKSSEVEENLEAMWMFGRYDNEYIKEDGKWKILKMYVYLHFLTPFHQGWLDCPMPGKFRTFDSEEGVQLDSGYTNLYLYKPEGPNEYGPPVFEVDTNKNK
jgi:hypothetical protein